MGDLYFEYMRKCDEAEHEDWLKAIAHFEELAMTGDVEAKEALDDAARNWGFDNWEHHQKEIAKSISNTPVHILLSKLNGQATPTEPPTMRAQVQDPTPTANQVDEEKNDTRQATTKQRSAQLIAILLIVLGVLIALATNVASSTLPKEWEPYLWLSWPLLGVLVMLSLFLVLRQNGTSETYGA